MTAGTDDTQPLLGPFTGQRQQGYSAPTAGPGDAADAAETIVVDFDADGDAENPLEWPTPFKWGVVSLLACMAFTVTFTCISVVPLASDIVRDLSASPNPSKSASVLLVTIWELGEAAGPLLIAPLSEMAGRRPVLNAANLLFVAATVLAASSRSVPQFVAARMLNGLAVASNVLNPAIVGDMFPSEQRGSPLSLIFLAPLVGGAVGPLIGSAVAQAFGWRSVLWAAVVLSSACEVLFLTCFRETYKVAILRRRVEKLAAGHAAGSRLRFKTAFDDAEGVSDEGSPSDWKKLRDAVMRPAVVLFGSGVLMAMSLFGSLFLSFFYIYSTTFSDILLDVYELSPVAVGFCFTIFSAGSTLSVFICNSTLDRIYVRMRDAHKGVGKPEYRLPLAIAGAFALSLSVAAYGWAAELRLPLAFFVFTGFAIGVAIMLGMIPVMAYVVDAFGLFSASATTGVIGWGFSVLAALVLIFAPIPILMFRYGAHWRKFSKYTRDA
ncbi:5f8ae36b-3033-4962-92d2-03b9cc23ed14 [Thermothielavioides terrestris]|uniref:5f8ae36b-3033-4962-92d2-03b9cc23ed14 n=1 Tax=Thermothielavioides terrestris TaxID=2587410 RepID=A0A446BUM1_9PEZI|nr:5f8ae36b-3033-4962-92d2-03b9cc23ed14 [Thermothielavioides terrestris]